jgi:hypothetical protein
MLVALQACNALDNAPSRTDYEPKPDVVPVEKPDDVALDPAASCDVLCAVPGGVDECPVGTPCPALTAEEADAVLQALTGGVYNNSRSPEGCEPVAQ